MPLQGPYDASKHALKGWLNALRVELMRERSPVRVTLVKPSSINTPLFDNARTYMGVTPATIPPIYEPELAAEGILRAAEGKERDVYIGGAARALSISERLNQSVVDLQMLGLGFGKQQRPTPKSPDGPNTLFEPLPDDGGAHGSFTGKARSWSLYQSVARHAVGAPLPAAAVLGLAALAAGRERDRGVVAGLLAMSAAGVAMKSVARPG